MVTVERDGAYLIFKRDGVEFYDTAIPAQADVGRLVRHLMDKNWMTQELKAETVRLVQEYFGEAE
jgi:hypothetical protein